MKILILNGPNLNLLGKRDKSHYGEHSLSDIENLVKDEFKNHLFEFYQSNSEGELVDQIQKAETYFDGIIINPGGYAHTSVAIRDALNESNLPKIEVHLSNLAKREEFRQINITASVCDGYLSGFKHLGYLAAVYLLEKIKQRTF
ncbi:MAG: 3-dehydroquinate dehydratase [Ignavibacteriales bacterium]|nr:MAG: 3-dehydroquinate dehydratase [Ignavibacteriales bacterium]